MNKIMDNEFVKAFIKEPVKWLGILGSFIILVAFLIIAIGLVLR